MELNNEQSFILDLVRNEFDVTRIDQIDFSKLNWEKVMEIIGNNMIFPICYKSLKSILPVEFQSLYSVKSLEIKRNIDKLVAELNSIYKKSQEDKIRFLIVKGIPLSLLVYGNIYDREICDIDILVEEEDAVRMDCLVRQLGYIQPYSIDWFNNEFKLLPYPIMRLRHTNHFFEYYKFGYITSKVEIHKYLYFVRPYITKFLWNSQTVNIQNIQINTLNMEYTLIFLFVNAFQNTESLYAVQDHTFIRDYIDLYFFIKKNKDSIDWNNILNLMIEYNILSISKTVLNNLKEIFLENSMIDFVCNKLKHDYSCQNNTLPWEMGFLERVFYFNERKAAVKHILKQQIFSDYKQNIMLDVFNDNNKKYYFIPYHNKLGLDIKYCITYSENGLFFKLKLDNKLIIDYNKFMLSISIFNNDINNQNLYTIFEIIQYNKTFTVRYMSTPIMRDANVLRSNSTYKENADLIRLNEEEGYLDLFIPYNIINSNALNLNIKLAYTIDLYKYVYGNIYHFVEDIPTDIRDSKVLQLI